MISKPNPPLTLLGGDMKPLNMLPFIISKGHFNDMLPVARFDRWFRGLITGGLGPSRKSHTAFLRLHNPRDRSRWPYGSISRTLIDRE